MQTSLIQRRSFLASSAVLLTACASKPAAAERVHFLIPFAAGASFDKTCRAAQAALLSSGLAKGATAENLVGSAGLLAFERLLDRRANNENTLMMVGSSLVARNAMGLFPHKLTDLMIVNRFSAEPLTFAVKAGSRITSLQDLLVSLRANPSSLRFCSDSVAGASEHLCAAKMLTRAGISPDGVKYNSISGNKGHINAVLSGQADVVVAAAADVLPFHRDKSLRVLAVSSDSRVSQMPDVPTVAQAGVTDAVFYNARGFFMAPTTSPARVAQMSSLLERLVKTTDWEKERAKAEVTMLFAGASEATKYFSAQEQEVRSLLSALKLIK